MHGKLKEMKALEAAATSPVYGQLPFLPDTAVGCEIITAEGRRILDFYPSVLRLLPPLVLQPAHVVKLADALQDIGSSSRHTAGKTGTA